MSTLGKIVLGVVGVMLVLMFLPTLFVSFEGAHHWVYFGSWTENIIGFGIALLVFFGLAALFISLFAGIFVVLAMIFGGLVLAGISAIWPILLFGAVLYFIFSSKKSDQQRRAAYYE
jgi:uncharacterized membrane-anchored protein